MLSDFQDHKKGLKRDIRFTTQLYPLLREKYPKEQGLKHTRSGKKLIHPAKQSQS
jgi:hypothetical protein